MKKVKGDELYINHIQIAINTVISYTDGVTEEMFQENSMIRDAVIRQLQIMGDAVKMLSVEYREKHGDIPWKDIAGMRDKLVHDYFGVDIDAVWLTVTRDIPMLKELLNMK